ncbi:MAG: class I SAM-dependent methyltransferase [Candidatus Bathyarchaeota archaeon]|nr:class I SAM-dependent methyltransferase [Candidatus Bathyarchaeota archaeon]
MNVFDEMGVYWAEMADKNHTEEQIAFLKSQLRCNGYILDLACGTGRHSILLSMEGYSVVGLDVSLRLLRIAKTKYKHVDLVRGDLRSLPFKPRAFMAAISMDTSLGYLPSEEADELSLVEARRALDDSGIFVVDVFNRENLESKSRRLSFLDKLKWGSVPFWVRLHSRRVLFWLFNWKDYPSFWLLQKRTLIQGSGCLRHLWVVCDKASGKMRIFEHVVRLYGLERLRDLLNSAGFLVNHAFGDYKGGEFSAGSSRLILVANTK